MRIDWARVILLLILAFKVLRYKTLGMAVTWSLFAHCRVFQKSGGIAQSSCHFDISIALVFNLAIVTWKFVSNPHTFGVYYRAHDMFSRIFRIRIYEFFHQYFSVGKENKFLIGHKMHFFLPLLSILDDQNKYYLIFVRKKMVDSYKENSWKHVVS